MCAWPSSDAQAIALFGLVVALVSSPMPESCRLHSSWCWKVFDVQRLLMTTHQFRIFLTLGKNIILHVFTTEWDGLTTGIRLFFATTTYPE